MTKSVEAFLLALAKTESRNTEAFGDKGQAMGRFQVHPAWLFRYVAQARIRVTVSDTWDDLAEAALRYFWLQRQHLTSDVEIAMEFHLGHFVPAGGEGWDSAYADRFSKFLAEVSSGG